MKILLELIMFQVMTVIMHQIISMVQSNLLRMLVKVQVMEYP